METRPITTRWDEGAPGCTGKSTRSVCLHGWYCSGSRAEPKQTKSVGTWEWHDIFKDCGPGYRECWRSKGRANAGLWLIRGALPPALGLPDVMDPQTAIAGGWYFEERKLDVAGCARTGWLRAGEAKRPAPSIAFIRATVVPVVCHRGNPIAEVLLCLESLWAGDAAVDCRECERPLRLDNAFHCVRPQSVCWTHIGPSLRDVMGRRYWECVCGLSAMRPYEYRIQWPRPKVLGIESRHLVNLISAVRQMQCGSMCQHGKQCGLNLGHYGHCAFDCQKCRCKVECDHGHQCLSSSRHRLRHQRCLFHCRHCATMGNTSIQNKRQDPFRTPGCQQNEGQKRRCEEASRC